MANMLKLLVITQKVDINDPILGFFHRWLEEFAKNVEKLTVICLEKGEYDLPENVKVLSLEKERVKNLEFGIWNLEFFKKLKYTFNFYKHIWQKSGNYDAVFVHMNPEYVVLGGFLWKILGKKISLWYVHKAVNIKLRIAEIFADKIFTASPESFRLPSKKIHIVGHGIDVSKFPAIAKAVADKQDYKLRVITAGRIAPVKNLEFLIEAAEILKNHGVDYEIKIAGEPITEADKMYFEKLKLIVRKKGLENFVSFAGPLAYRQMPNFYGQGDIFVNLSETGSLDKAVLEAMACGLSVVTSNEAFREILPAQYFLENKNPEILTEKIKKISVENRPNLVLQEIVVKKYSLETMISKIFSYF